jgi:hypothetical protein
MALSSGALLTQGAREVNIAFFNLGTWFDDVVNLEYPASFTGMRQLDVHLAESLVFQQQFLEFTAVYLQHPFSEGSLI